MWHINVCLTHSLDSLSGNRRPPSLSAEPGPAQDAADVVAAGGASRPAVLPGINRLSCRAAEGLCSGPASDPWGVEG